MVVKEGESGNNFYIVSEGDYDCYKVDNKDRNIFVKQYGAG